MEILNNIWKVLNTPNGFYTELITTPFTFIELYLAMNIFLSLLNIETTNQKKTFYVVLSSLISIITRFTLPNPFNVLLNYLICFLLILVIFRLSFFKSFFAIVSSISILGIIGSLILNPYLTIFKITTDELATIPIYNILHLIILLLIAYLLILIFRHRDLKITLYEDIDQKSKLMILTNLIFGIIVLIIQICILFYYVDLLPIILTFLSFISMLAYWGISIYSLTRVMKLILTTKKLESAEEYNKTLHILHDSVRGFKHDFDNIVTTIGGYIRTDDMKGLENYYVQLEDDCQRVNNLYLLNPEIINNPGIYNLLTSKYHEADSQNIKVNMTFLLDLSTLKMKIYEFARILGILLDNAIEASKDCNEKIINITFRNDIKNNRQLICIENTYNNKNIDTEEIFKKGISEKENHTGLGLWEVRKIIKKNNNVNLFTSKTNKYFSQQLEIY